MNIKAAYKYQLTDRKRSIIVFYCVILILTIFLGVMSVNFSSEGSMLSGMETATAIFLFILGLCTFKEPFFMLLQNGVSRKTIFKSQLFVTITITFIMAVIDKIFFIVDKSFSSLSNSGYIYLSLYEQIYNMGLPFANTFSLHVKMFIFYFLMYLAIFAIGYLITLIFYRLNKYGRIAVGAGVPVGLFIILPIMDNFLFDSRISHAIGSFFDFALGITSHNPYAAMISFTVAFVILSLLSWLLLRKAVVNA